MKVMHTANVIHINVVVDVMKALSEGTLEHNVYLMDDSPWGSEGQGTAALRTACRPGDTLHWTVCPIDLQAGTYIEAITFGVDEMQQEQEQTAPALKTWEGILPFLQPGDYPYRLYLRIGSGKNSLMAIDTVSLRVEENQPFLKTEEQ